MKKMLFVLFISFVLVSCSKEEPSKGKQPAASADTAVSVKPVVTNMAPVPASQADFDFTKIALGGKLFKENCAACHGNNAEGTPDWRKRNPDGTLKPPPLDGTAHTWHHPKELLMSIITTGTANMGGNMPAWGDKLSQQEIDAILTWVQSKWPEEIYTNWLEINRR